MKDVQVESKCPCGHHAEQHRIEPTTNPERPVEYWCEECERFCDHYEETLLEKEEVE